MFCTVRQYRRKWFLPMVRSVPALRCLHHRHSARPVKTKQITLGDHQLVLDPIAHKSAPWDWPSLPEQILLWQAKASSIICTLFNSLSWLVMVSDPHSFPGCPSVTQIRPLPSLPLVPWDIDMSFVISPFIPTLLCALGSLGTQVCLPIPVFLHASSITTARSRPTPCPSNSGLLGESLNGLRSSRKLAVSDYLSRFFLL